MKRFLTSLVVIVLLGANASCSTTTAADRTERLDMLFQRLQSAHSDEEAQSVETLIRHLWARSGREDVDAMLMPALTAMQLGDYDQAQTIMDQIVLTAPDFAEAWNIRASIHYLKDEYGMALSDITRVLTLEPRHFGALSGLGRIFLELEDKKAALKAFEAALVINPHLSDIRRESDELREELAGIPI